MDEEQKKPSVDLDALERFLKQDKEKQNETKEVINIPVVEKEPVAPVVVQPSVETPQEEAVEEIEDDEPEDEEEPIEEEEIDEKPDVVTIEEKKYEEILNEQPEIKQYLEYAYLKQKAEKGQKLTQEEIKFKESMDEMVAKEKEANDKQRQKELAEAKRQEALQKQIMVEYLETKQKAPEKVVQVRERDITLTGGESIPKMLGLIFAMRKAKKKGGKVLVQIFRNRKVLIKWTTNEVSFVEFFTTDEKGNELMEVTRFSEYPYSFEGSPVPVLFAVQGYAEGFDFFSEFRKDLSSEMVNRLVTRAFHAGYLKGAEVAPPNKKKEGMLDGLQTLTPLIVLGVAVIGGFMMYQMYNDMHAMKASIDTIVATAPHVIQDANAIILK